ncbi:MAG: hypothetical protein HZC54_13510 [Verrucomicrobia bacterium]|nr:hypothetical protein [Verrucomicrobiota bacterium]
MKITAGDVWLAAALLRRARDGERVKMVATRHTHRSAGFQPAVSRVSNPLALRDPYGLPTGSRRHSRLETCATRVCDGACARLRPVKIELA